MDGNLAMSRLKQIIQNSYLMVDANNKLIDSVDINWNREGMMEFNCNYRV